MSILFIHDHFSTATIVHVLILFNQTYYSFQLFPFGTIHIVFSSFFIKEKKKLERNSCVFYYYLLGSFSSYSLRRYFCVSTNMLANRYIVISTFNVVDTSFKSAFILDFSLTYHMIYNSQYFLKNISPSNREMCLTFLIYQITPSLFVGESGERSNIRLNRLNI